MGIPKPPRGKLPLPILAFIICALAFFVLLYTESISFFSSTSFIRFKPCARKYAAKKTSTENRKVDEVLRRATDDRFEFDPKECSLNQGKWVFNRTMKPLYTDTSCPYLDRQVSCVKNGKRDYDYQKWEWEPDDFSCRFDAKTVLLKLRGKRTLFVGDSLQRGQWQSLVCLVEFSLAHFIEHQERRLGEREGHQMLQRDEADQEQMALGDRLRPAGHERRRRRGRKDEDSGDGAEHNSAIGVQNRRSLFNLHRIWGEIVDGRREEGSIAPRGLHTLVHTWSSRHLESNPLRAFALLVTEKF